jgi:DNA-binding SARP family transcriptional activator/RecA/RadA recombinase
MLRIRLVGELRVDLDGRTLEPIASRRARSLLAWLAYHPGTHPRSRVASVFWPDVLESSARGNLRTTLTTLRRELGEAAAGCILAQRERVGIADGAQVWIDVREAVRLADEGRAGEALALCDGDLLTDLDDDWVLDARHQHGERVGELLVVLGDAAEAGDDLQAAVRFARRRLELDPVSEDAARVLMRRLAQSGDRAAALAAYDVFRSALRRELGLAPSAPTRALVDELREDRAGRAGVDELPLPGALARGEHAPFVGRREPLAALRAVWRQASAGAATVVMVVGEAGSGKTRLLTELAGEAHASGATVLAGRCREDGVVGFAPFTEALRAYAAAFSGALPEWVVRELGRLLPELDPEAGAPEGEPQDARHRLFEAVAAAIGHAARRTPVLLVVEDLHWADPATLQMLEHVVRTVGWAPLLVAGSHRDAGAESAPALHALLGDLRRERDFEPVVLAGLSGNEVGDLTAAWLGTSDSPPALAAEVHRRTDGNPLFVEELVRHLVESGAEQLVEAARTDVPHGVRSVIDRRVAHLPEISAQAVRVAAVAGQDFALADVATACEAADEPIAAGLDAAVGAGLVDETETPGHYRFAHALIREAVLAGLTATRRALLHRRMAEVLEALPDSRRAARAPELARHLLDARPLVDPALAARAALRAAEEATRRLAYEDAAELLERAAAGDLDERDPLRAEVLLALGDARLRSGDAPVADRCFAEAAAIARTLGEHDMVARAALGAAGLTVTVRPERPAVRALLEEAVASLDEASALRPRLLARLAIEVYYVPPATLRERLSEEALAAGRRTGGRALLEALGARHVALWSPDHTEERLAIADELVATARATGDREAELQGVNWRVPDLFELGELDAVRDAITHHERLAGELHLPTYAWYAPMWRAALALLEGRPEEARRLSEESERIGRAAHDDNAELLCEVQRTAINAAMERVTDEDIAIRDWHAEHSPAGSAWRTAVVTAAVQRGELDRAQRLVEREVAGLDSVSLDANWLYAMTGFGILAARLGNVAGAAALYPRLLPYGHRVVTCGRATYCTGSASLALGLLAATLCDRPAAVAHLEEAVRRNDALGAVAYAAAARHALAGLVEDPALRRESEAAAAAIEITLPDGLLWRL